MTRHACPLTLATVNSRVLRALPTKYCYKRAGPTKPSHNSHATKLYVFFIRQQQILKKSLWDSGYMELALSVLVNHNI